MAPLPNHHRCDTPIDRDGPDGVVGLTPMLDEVLPNCVERLNEALRIVDRSQLALLAQQISVEGTQRGLCDISHCASRVEQAVL